MAQIQWKRKFHRLMYKGWHHGNAFGLTKLHSAKKACWEKPCCMNLVDMGTMEVTPWSPHPSPFLPSSHLRVRSLDRYGTLQASLYLPLIRCLFSSNYPCVYVQFTVMWRKNLKTLAPTLKDPAHTSDAWKLKPWVLCKLYSEWQIFSFCELQ